MEMGILSRRAHLGHRHRSMPGESMSRRHHESQRFPRHLVQRREVRKEEVPKLSWRQCRRWCQLVMVVDKAKELVRKRVLVQEQMVAMVVRAKGWGNKRVVGQQFV